MPLHSLLCNLPGNQEGPKAVNSLLSLWFWSYWTRVVVAVLGQGHQVHYQEGGVGGMCAVAV